MLTFLLVSLIYLSQQLQNLAVARRHCHDLWLYEGKRISGLYEIDPDGDGELSAFTVFCDMGDGIEERKIVTVVHHDSEETGQVKGAEAPGSYMRNVTYKNATEAQVVALIDASTNCEQYIKWYCKGAKFGFWYPLETATWWVGRNWEPQFYWGGAAKDSRTCGCHPYCNLTNHNSTCNCDANTKLDWLTDEGLLLDRSRLPVLQLRIGDTGQTNEVGLYTLGPLKCRNVSLKDNFLQNFTAPVKLASPGFPRYYPRPFNQYHWDVVIPEGMSVEVIFPTYDVIHYGAYLSVPGCESVMRLEAKAQSSPIPIVVEKQKKSEPYFVSDGTRTVVRLSMITCNQMDTVSEKGFEAEFRQKECPGCDVGRGSWGGVTQCSGQCGIIASYNYPYPNHDYEPPSGVYNHTWIITPPHRKGIKLTFGDFDIPGVPGSRTCSKEREVLSVYSRGRSGPEKLVGHFCNYNKQGNLYTKGHLLRLVYVVRFEKVGNGRGFQATYRATPKRDLPHSDGVMENVARGKPARQSSTLENQGAHLAVDGALSAGSCISTNFEKEPWWRVDLQQRHLIYGVKIYNRELKTSPSAISVNWPKGQYGLPKPRSGCPATPASQWQSGMRYHDMECPVAMDGSIKHWTDGIQLQGGLQELQGIEQHFCMITGQRSGTQVEWMPGQYCIFRYGGECPSLFRTGYIRWTEKEGNNKNYKEGVLPDGIYENYTLIHFCCRGDGEVDKPIRLPTETPFYLLQYGIECQRVEGMNHRQHFFHFCEDRIADINNADHFKKPHPMVNTLTFEKGFALHYCYYDISTSLRGFQVLVDNVGFIQTWTRFWDNKHYGIAHEAHDKFSQAYICIHHPVTEKEVPLVDKNCTQPVVGQFVTLYVYDRYDSLQVCEVEIYGKKVCGKPLGMAAEEILDWQISATSSTAQSYHQTNGRLNNRLGWCANPDDELKSLQVDLGNITEITGLVTQGLSQASQFIYVKTFLLSFSNDNVTWWNEEEPVGVTKVYRCHQCQVQDFTNDLEITYNMLTPINARFLRFAILDFRESPCARIEILGCRGTDHCGSNYSAPMGTVTSPNYPYYYGQDRSCWWTITPPQDKHVQLNFYLVELANKESQQLAGDCTDVLTVNPGPHSLAIKSTQGKKFPRYIVSNGTLQIHLQSCFRATVTRRRGFYANYSFVDCPGCGIGDYDCAELHVCTSQCGHIMSAGYPLSYTHHHRCRWHIRVPIDHYINITVQDLDINGSSNCANDFVDIYDGEVAVKKATHLGRFCNGRPPTQTLVTNWNTITIEFSSGAGIAGRGFLFKYTAQRYKLPEKLQNIGFDDPQLCPIPWKQYNNYCYGLFEERNALQWYAAENKCVKKGGHLVSIHDKLEMTVLHHLLTNEWHVGRWQTPGVYIGLTDETGEGNFRWTDGNPMSYADWANQQSGEDDTHQPNGGQYEDCTKIYLNNIHSTSSWFDIPCSLDSTNGINAYICKKRSLVVQNLTFPEGAFRDGFQTTTNAPTGMYFLCSSLEFVSQMSVCDGKVDCADGSDESKCLQPCPGDSFTCANRRCISLYRYCDFKNDCGDGSDEITCEHVPCNETEQFRCTNGQCIPISKTCDLNKDCVDGSDEIWCSGKCQHNNTFQCYDGTCIPRSTYCDGYYDCPGFHHEDEIKTCLKNKFHHPYTDPCPKYYRSCYELLMANQMDKSGYYEIDPDGTGPLMPFTVECRISKDNKTAWTYVHHDTESRMYVRESAEGPGSYRRDLIYDDASFQQLEALVNISRECQQMVQWQCKGAGFHFNQKVPTSWWVSRDGTLQYSWGAGWREGMCNCTPNCQDGLLCNCDADHSLRWREDAGYLKNKTKLPVRQVHFGNTHITGRAGFHTIGPLECNGGVADENRNEFCFLDREILCQNGARVDRKHECLYEFDANGYMLGCRDASHLRDCEEFHCPPFYHKCPGSHCIPHRYRCNGVRDCPGGYDEIKCADGLECKGQYHCVNQTYCIPLSQVCNGIKQCQEGDDETFCDVICPSVCECSGVYAKCVRQNLSSVPSLMADLRKLDLSHNKLIKVVMEHTMFYLGELCLAHNEIVTLMSGSFKKFSNLYRLDLSHNQIELIEKEAFLGLGNLKTLILDGNNRLKTIESNAFRGLKSLPQLCIAHTQLSRLDVGVFAGLQSLRLLNLSRNKIQIVADGAFSGLNSVRILDLHGNTIREFSKEIFFELRFMDRLITDSFKFCCLAQPYVQFEHCLPQADEFSSCKDLMSNLVLRVFLWALGIVALIGNLVVIVWRSGIKDVKKASSALILSLGCADFLMGVYLIIVASVDTHYRGDYIAHSDTWRESALCKAAGFLSTLSSEASVFTLTFITLERMVCIAFPLSTHRFTAECTRGLIIGSWVSAAVLAGLPLWVRTYFHDQFYARSGVCLALHITNQKPAGWEYSVIVFFCINLIVFVVILVAYIYMYVSIRRATRRMSFALTRKASEAKVCRQMTLIVLTNFCCWMPIILMGLCAMAGLSIPGEVYAWTAVFILPLNSATNPIVYTLCSEQFKTMILRKYFKPKRTLSTQLQNTCTSRSRNERYIRSYRPPHGYCSLVQFLRTSTPLLLSDVLEISKGICETLAELHETGLAFGGFQMDYIFVQKIETGNVNVYLPDINAYHACIPGGNVHSEESAKDMEDFGKIVKKMLQIYHVTCRQGDFTVHN